MNLRICRLLATAAFAVLSLLGSGQTLAQNAYITNFVVSSVSVIDTATNTVTTTIPVGEQAGGVAVSPDGSRIYVAGGVSSLGGNVVVIDAATNTVIAAVLVGINPAGVAVTPDGSRLYVT